MEKILLDTYLTFLKPHEAGFQFCLRCSDKVISQLITLISFVSTPIHTISNVNKVAAFEGDFALMSKRALPTDEQDVISCVFSKIGTFVSGHLHQLGRPKVCEATHVHPSDMCDAQMVRQMT